MGDAGVVDLGLGDAHVGVPMNHLLILLLLASLFLTVGCLVWSVISLEERLSKLEKGQK